MNLEGPPGQAGWLGNPRMIARQCPPLSTIPQNDNAPKFDVQGVPAVVGTTFQSNDSVTRDKGEVERQAEGRHFWFPQQEGSLKQNAGRMESYKNKDIENQTN